MVFCDGPFSLAFTTLDPSSDWTVGGQLVVLRFGGPPESAKFRDVLALDDADTREAVILGGIAVRPCNIAGVASDGVQPCSPAYFERYWSTEPFVLSDASPAVKLARKAPEPPPPNSVLYTAGGPCWGCDQSDSSMSRHVVDGAGQVTTTTLLENGKGILDGWLIGSLSASPDGAVLAAMVCDWQYCGALGSEKPEATWRVVWSKDGGATWTEAFRERTEYAWIGNVTRVGFVVRTLRANPSGATQTVYVVRGTETRLVAPPPGLPERPDVALLEDGSVVWIPLSEYGLVVGGLRGEDGRRLPIALPAGAVHPRLGSFVDGRTWATWYHAGYNAAVFKTNGELEAIYELGDVIFAALPSGTTGIGTVSTPGFDGSLLALLDFVARTVTPFGAPFGDPPLDRRNRFLAFQQGR